MKKLYVDKLYYKDGQLLNLTGGKIKLFYDIDSHTCYKETITKKGTKLTAIGVTTRSGNNHYHAYGLYVNHKARGYASLSRLVASAIYQDQLEYIAANNMVVHHIDCNIDNNDYKNLIFVDKKTHQMLHDLIRKYKLEPWLALLTVNKSLDAKIVAQSNLL